MNVEYRKILSKINKKTYQQLVDNEKVDDKLITNFPSKNGTMNVSYLLDNREYCLHSKYNPETEIERILAETIKNQDNKEPYFLFVGIGTGLQIKKTLEQFPNAHYIIFEPKVELLINYFNQEQLPQFKWKNCDDIVSDWTGIQNKKTLIEHFTKDMIEIVLPTYSRIFEHEITQFYSSVKNELKELTDGVRVNFAFQERWTINSIMNSSKVLQTSNFLHTAPEVLKNKPVLLVSAGPSLSEDIELIRKIKLEGRAYIFAVGSAANALIAENIIPDTFFSYDPKVGNQIALQEIRKEKLAIPIVFGSTIGYETLQRYPGKMSHFITSQDSYAQYLFDAEKKDIIDDNPSIAVLTLDILLRLECYPIILAGQNLGFLNNQRYADSIKYEHVSNELTKEEQAKNLQTMSVDGTYLETNETFENMKLAMERTIQRYQPEQSVINTTKKGAAIQGTLYKPLEEVLELYLNEKNILADEEFHNIFSERQNLDTYFERNEKVLEEFEALKQCLQNAGNSINEIVKAYQTKVLSNLNTKLIKFDKEFEKVNNNLFYKLFIVPMIRIQEKNFKEHSGKVVETRQPLKKAEAFIEIFVSYFGNIVETFNKLQPNIHYIDKEKLKVENK